MDNLIFDVNASGGEPIQLRIDDFTTIPVFEQYPVGFGDLESPIEVIPNPFTNAINFSFYQRSEGNVRIKILSSTGAEVFQETYALPEGSVNLKLDRLNNLPTGSYVYQIIQEGQLASGKLLKL